MRILERLLDGQPKKRFDIEIDESIRHSSMVDRWNELLEEKLIEEVDTNELTKKRVAYNTGKITLLGQVKGFRDSSRDRILHVMPFLDSIFLGLGNERGNLLDNFTEEQIFETIHRVLKNFEIIWSDVSCDIKRKKEIDYFIPASFLTKNIKWVQRYKVKITIQDGNIEDIITEEIFFGGKEKQTMATERIKAEYKIKEIITFVFLYQLHLDEKIYDLKYGHRIFGNYILRIVKTDPFFNKIFDKYLTRLENRHRGELEVLKNIKKIIS